MRTLVIGVGYTGRRLLERLPDAVGLSRSAPDPARRLDLDDDGEKTSLTPFSGAGGGYDLVYTVAPDADVGGDDDDPRVARLLSRLPVAPRRFVYLSTTGVYGDRDGAVVDESTPVKPRSARAVRRVVVERQLGRCCESNGCVLVILRVPGIYGPGRLGVERVRERAPVLEESAANPGNRIHVDDLVSCCIAALADGVPAGIYNVGDGDERSSTWFASEVARQLGVAPPPTVTRSDAEREFSPMRLSFLAESRRVDTRRMREVLGVVPRYPDAAEGIRASLAAERA